MRGLVIKLAARPWWLLACVVLSTAGFTAAAFLMTPIYRATMILVPANPDKGLGSAGGSDALGQLGGLASLAGINVGGGDSDTEEALAVFKSREFTESFINEKNLMPELFPKAWDASSGKWRVDEKKRPTPAKAYRYFDKKIRSIGKDKKTDLIILNIDWRDRFEAASWANELVQRLNLEMRQREIARSDASVGYLEKEFASTSEIATREAISHLMESAVKQRMLATVTQEFSFRVIDKAMPPDRDDRYKPDRIVLLAAGPLAGLVFGILLIFGYDALTTEQNPSKASK